MKIFNKIFITCFVCLQLFFVSDACAKQIVGMGTKEFNAYMAKQEAKKKVTVLFFFETWIPECQSQAVRINKLFRRYVKKNVMVYGISFSDTVDKGLKSWVSKNHLRFPVIVTDEKIAAKYNVVRYPYVCVVDTYGDTVKRYVGGVSYEKMADYLDKLLEELKKTEDEQ